MHLTAAGAAHRRRCFGLAALAPRPRRRAGIANPYDCTPAGDARRRPSRRSDDLGLYTPVDQRGRRERRRELDARRRRDRRRRQRAVADRRRRPTPLARPPRRLLRGHRADLHRPDYPYFRALRPQRGLAKRSLKIDVLYYDTKGKLAQAPSPTATRATRRPGSRRRHDRHRASSTKKRRSPRRRSRSASPPTGKDAHFQIDDVYVDPYSRSR